MPVLRNAIIACLAITFLCCFSAIAQNNTTNKSGSQEPSDGGVTRKIVAAVDSFNRTTPREKIFVQTDRPTYNNTDTIWLKAYVLDAGLNYSKQSGLLYTELIDDTGKVVLRQSMPVRDGLSFGQVILDNKIEPEGDYTLRVYTNWMQNQQTESFFTQRIYIGTINNDAWLINKDTRLNPKNGQDNLIVSLHLNKADNQSPVLLQDVGISIMNGTKRLLNDHMKTDISGKLDFNFNLPDNRLPSTRIILTDAGNKNGSHKLIIPVPVDRNKYIDLQFMPEGGKMVTGLPSIVGFKAISEDGKGVNVNGKILDSKGNVVTIFRSSHLGMGSFTLMPQQGETYTAKIDSVEKTYLLPAAAPSGVALHVNNPADKDSVYIKVLVSEDIKSSGQVFSLVGLSDDEAVYAATLTVENGVTRAAISKQRFKSGIAHFTVFDLQHRPVAERLVFIDHHDRLKIQVETQKQAYQPRDSVSLHVQVTSADGKPVRGSFSLALTDDKQVKTDTNTLQNINTYMLLTGDLKGAVEQPGYYFNPQNPNRYDDIDKLLLTQGWMSYDWKSIFSGNYQPAYQPEPEIAVTGQVSRVGGKAIAGLHVILLSAKKPVLLRDELTDDKGRFAFRNLPRIDTGNFLVQVKDVKGKMFEANVTVDEFKPAGTIGLDNSLLQPWYVNTDSTLLNNNLANIKMDEMKFPPGSRVLKEVKIKALKTVKGSHFFAGSGAVPDVVLDETDMRKANKMTIDELLAKKINGFLLAPYPCTGFPSSLEYQIGCNVVVFFIDGFAVDEFYQPQPGFTDHSEYIKSFIGRFTAEDVRGIEEKDEAHFSIIEITTWSGNGAFMKRVQGRYLYRPVPVSWPKDFYHPKYTSSTGNPLSDLRPTVLWEPNIITDTAGRATVWFYAKSKATGYTGVINGSDLSGNTGAVRFTIQTK